MSRGNFPVLVIKCPDKSSLQETESIWLTVTGIQGGHGRWQGVWRHRQEAGGSHGIHIKGPEKDEHTLLLSSLSPRL